MFDDDKNQLTIGDLVPNVLVWEDDAEKRVLLIRDGDQIHIRTEWKKVSALLDANHETAMAFNATGKLNDMVHVASVPLGIHYQWQAEGITHDDAAIARRLNDGDFAKFRTNNLKV